MKPGLKSTELWQSGAAVALLTHYGLESEDVLVRAVACLSVAIVAAAYALGRSRAKAAKAAEDETCRDF